MAVYERFSNWLKLQCVQDAVRFIDAACEAQNMRCEMTFDRYPVNESHVRAFSGRFQDWRDDQLISPGEQLELDALIESILNTFAIKDSGQCYLKTALLRDKLMGLGLEKVVKCECPKRE